jgi:hypothetical protein
LAQSAVARATLLDLIMQRNWTRCPEPSEGRRVGRRGPAGRPGRPATPNPGGHGRRGPKSHHPEVARSIETGDGHCSFVGVLVAARPDPTPRQSSPRGPTGAAEPKGRHLVQRGLPASLAGVQGVSREW